MPAPTSTGYEPRLIAVVSSRIRLTFYAVSIQDTTHLTDTVIVKKFSLR